MRSPLSGFFLRVLLWLPVSFGGWFFFAILMSAPVAWLSSLGLPALFPELFAGVLRDGYLLDMVTRFAPPGEFTQGRVAELVFSVNPMIYGYGIPLFTALVLATADEPGFHHWWIWGGGLVLLVLVQTFGVTLEALKVVAFNLGPEVAAQAGFAPWQRELVALGYQLGTLVLPAMTPVALWLGAYRRFVVRLAPGFPPPQGGAERDTPAR
jgi:hypothetical protein